MNKEFLELEISKADDLLRQLGTINEYDVRMLFCEAYGRKAFRFKVKEAITNHLNKTYDFIDDTDRTWYFKKLKKYVCRNCGKEFKIPNAGAIFCSKNCKTKYLKNKEQEVIEC